MSENKITFTSNERFEHQLVLEVYRENPHESLSTIFKITLQPSSREIHSINIGIFDFRNVVSTFRGVGHFNGVGGVYHDKDNYDLKLLMFADIGVNRVFMTITKEDSLGDINGDNVYHFTKDQIAEIGDKFQEIANSIRI